MKSIYFWANPDRRCRARCPGTRLPEILTHAPQEHIRGRTLDLSQRQLVRITRSESSEFIDLTFPERCLERKTARERRGGGCMIRSHICLPTEPMQGWCCKAQRAAFPKSRVNAKDETVGIWVEPHYPILPCGMPL
jgi:hypothetical protein